MDRPNRQIVEYTVELKDHTEWKYKSEVAYTSVGWRPLETAGNFIVTAHDWGVTIEELGDNTTWIPWSLIYKVTVR